MATEKPRDSAELKALAASLDCFTESELQVLANVTPGTAEAWRKRGQGPAYCLFGNTYLYPKAGVAGHLKTLVRERKAPDMKGLL